MSLNLVIEAAPFSGGEGLGMRYSRSFDETRKSFGSRFIHFAYFASKYS